MAIRLKKYVLKLSILILLQYKLSLNPMKVKKFEMKLFIDFFLHLILFLINIKFKKHVAELFLKLYMLMMIYTFLMKILINKSLLVIKHMFLLQNFIKSILIKKNSFDEKDLDTVAHVRLLVSHINFEERKNNTRIN